jgi:ribosomal protein L29
MANEKSTENEAKINELKIELLKQPTKRKMIRKEIARLLTKQHVSQEAKK